MAQPDTAKVMLHNDFVLNKKQIEELEKLLKQQDFPVNSNGKRIVTVNVRIGEEKLDVFWRNLKQPQPGEGRESKLNSQTPSEAVLTAAKKYGIKDSECPVFLDGFIAGMDYITDCITKQEPPENTGGEL